MAKKKRIDLSKAESSSLNPLAAALLKNGLQASEPPEAPSPKTDPRVVHPLDPTLWKTQIEKKGHGGKTVTLVRGMKDPEQVAIFLKKKLGTAAKVRDDHVVVQGDLRQRIAGLQ